MEEDFLKEKCFQFGVSLLLPLCFPRVKTEGVKTWVCSKLFCVMM